MFVLEAKICNDVSILATILFIKKLVRILSIIIPILLVLLVTIDIAKAVIASDDNQIKKAQSLAIKRIIYAIIIFFVPIVTNAVLSMIGNSATSGITCYNIATDDVVDILAEAEKESLLKYQDEIQKLIEAAIISKELAAQRLQELRQSTHPTSTSEGSVCTNCSSSEKIAQTAELLAWPENTPKSKYVAGYRKKKFTSWSQLKKAKPPQVFMDTMDRVMPNHFKWRTSYPAIRIGQSCDTFVGVVVAAAGYDTIGNNHNTQHTAFTTHKKKWQKVSKPRRGDICRDSAHVKVYLGNGKIAEASYGTIFGHIRKGNCNKSIRIWRAIG